MEILEDLVRKISLAKSIVLTTHRQCDGDGLGSQIALYHALKKIGKNVRILNVDATPKKYHFLNTTKLIEHFEGSHQPLETCELALIFDTNDARVVEPLFSHLKIKCKEIVFIDHHPVLFNGPSPTAGSVILPHAASTGEIVFNLVKLLKINFDDLIARALYTSLVFDTQLFRFVRNSPSSHLMAAELLQFEKNPEEVHRLLFATFTPQKMSFLAKALGQIEFFGNGRVAILKLFAKDLIAHEMEFDESRDVVDMIMNVESVEAAALFREDGSDVYKVSIRSKGQFEVLSVAESLGGGGHIHSSGAFLEGSYEAAKHKVVAALVERVQNMSSFKKDESA